MLSKKVKEVIKIFKKITKIPRLSKNEEKIRKWLIDYGQKKNWQVEVDNVGNVLMRVQASQGRENEEGVVLQTHMDMVGEKESGVIHDFNKDAIEIKEIEGWLRAKKRTTLGADDGIGMALALYVAEYLKHPPLELLFTVDEETGLTGAQALKNNWLNFTKLINLDSEDMGIITIGCAGSINISGEKRGEIQGIQNNKGWKIEIIGGKGGHSGIEIDKKIANAHKLLARILKNQKKIGIVSWEGGKVHNAIPGKARVVISGKLDLKKLEKAKEIIEKEWQKSEPTLKIKKQIIGLRKEKSLDEVWLQNMI